ncbi:hypothetical protein SAMN03159496_02602 [Rhizobium sp. NFR07]|uniref:hypothetical protein n=1 Tax=Rhizobium sp. NFR07 TaxID=1566262 RepID=UPI0008E01644|nr:hypothetical protein [Rhizobium sp. NFR07]SFB25838.1 hypothetical protein SAMN03159496_02602 [Rhizobium sp. NFR07]
MNFLKTLMIAGAISLFSTVTFAQEIPAPVHGVTFDEWASAAARLSNKTSEDEVLKTLSIDKQQFEEVNESFSKALKDDKDFKLITYYGQAFSNLNAGRFAANSQETERKLKTFEDYARLSGHMQAATEAGVDPQKVLEEHHLTTFEFSQDGTYWIGKLREQGMAGDSAAILKWNETIAAYKAEYAARYAKK